MEKPRKKFRRRAEARPDEVLDAALAVFVEKGFATAKVDDIARRAGVSKGTVYLYFASKQALMEGIVRRAVSPIAQGAAAEIAGFEGDPRVPITLLLRRLCALLAEPANLALPKLFLREALNFPDIARTYRESVLERIMPAVAGLVARGIASGHLRPVDPDMAIRSIVGPLVAHVALSEVFGVTPADGLALERLLENHLTILFDGLAAREANNG